MSLPPTGASPARSTSRSSSLSRLLLAWGFPVIIGFVGTYITFKVRVPLQLPGHTGMVQMLALLIGYLVSRNRAGGIAGGVGALLAGTMVEHDPVKSIGLVAAGAVLDGGLYLVRKLPVQWLWVLLAGGLGNGVVFAVKLLSGDVPKAVLRSGIGFGLLSYVGFGLVGGLLAALALAARKADADQDAA